MILKHDLDVSLKLLLRILDAWTQMFFGEEITQTCGRRPPGKNPSYHPIGQAVDLRTKGVEPLAIAGWEKIIKVINDNNGVIEGFEGKFTYLREDEGGNNDHFHLQLRRGKPV